MIKTINLKPGEVNRIVSKPCLSKACHDTLVGYHKNNEIACLAFLRREHTQRRESCPDLTRFSFVLAIMRPLRFLGAYLAGAK